MKSLQTMMDLHGRVAVITGGAGHLGRAMAQGLAEMGAAIALVDLDDAAGQRAVDDIRSQYRVPASMYRVDVTDHAGVRELSGRIVRELGSLDILINNAALVGTTELEGWAVSFPGQSVDTWRSALEVNLTAPFVWAQACREALVASRHASIINIGSIYGMVAPDMTLYDGTSLGNPAAYAASKGGLLQLTRWLSTVLAPDIRVNTVTLGGVWRNQDETFQQRYVSRTPLKRMATEEDLKGAVAYLASDASAYVTGQNLVVDGGWTAW